MTADWHWKLCHRSCAHALLPLSTRAAHMRFRCHSTLKGSSDHLSRCRALSAVYKLGDASRRAAELCTAGIAPVALTDLRPRGMTDDWQWKRCRWSCAHALLPQSTRAAHIRLGCHAKLKGSSDHLSRCRALS